MKKDNDLVTEKHPRYININFKLSEPEKDALVAYANANGINSLHIAARTAAISKCSDVISKAKKSPGFSDIALNA